jgi:hypothetical protein
VLAWRAEAVPVVVAGRTLRLGMIHEGEAAGGYDKEESRARGGRYAAPPVNAPPGRRTPVAVAGRRVDGEESRDEEEYHAREDVALPPSCDVFKLLCRRKVGGADGWVPGQSKQGKEGGRKCGRSSGLFDRQCGGDAPTLPPPPPPPRQMRGAPWLSATGSDPCWGGGHRREGGSRARRTIVEEEGDLDIGGPSNQ